MNLLPQKRFFDLGLEVLGEGELQGELVDRADGLNDVRVAVAMLRVPDGQANVALIQFYTPSDEKGIRPPLANTPGIRHIAFAVEDIEAMVAKLKKKGVEFFSEMLDYEGSYKYASVTGPRGLFSSWTSKSNKLRVIFTGLNIKLLCSEIEC